MKQYSFDIGAWHSDTILISESCCYMRMVTFDMIMMRSIGIVYCIR